MYLPVHSTACLLAFVPTAGAGGVRHPHIELPEHSTDCLLTSFKLQVLVESATNNTETERLVYRVWGSWHDLLYYFNYRWEGGGWGGALSRAFWAAETGTCVKGWARSQSDTTGSLKARWRQPALLFFAEVLRLPLTPCIP